VREELRKCSVERVRELEGEREKIIYEAEREQDHKQSQVTGTNRVTRAREEVTSEESKSNRSI